MAGRTTLRLALLAFVLDSRLFVAAGTTGDDFTNNLFTDLAPLLGLFGEKFAQQFLAESFTFWDHILFAMAPLGILTAVVGAIRVDGANWLKELVGRARETTSGAEIELMSSVSQEVCEVWNGASIVRSMGSPQVKQIIHLPAGKDDFSPESFITMDRKTWSRDYALKAQYWSAKDTGSEKLSTNEDDNGGIEKGHNNDTVKEIPPNISLNIHGGSNRAELVVYAFIAFILQAAVIGWSSYAYKHKLFGSKPSVGFPLQVAGTVLLTLGLALCAGVIDNGSRERHWLAKDKCLQEKKDSPRRHMQLYWVQKQHIAGDNSFDPYILYAEELNDKVHDSHRAKENGRNDRDDKVHESPRAKETVQKDRGDKFLGKLLRLFGHHLTTFAVVIALLGFVAQFQGLRFSNWTCSIAQLVALGFATILRAWVRRTMTKTPVAVPADNDYILAHLTMAIVGRARNDSKFPHHDAFRSPGLSLRFGITTCPKLKIITEESTTSESRSTSNVQHSIEGPNLAQEALNLRVRLGRITKWTGAKSQEAIVLSNSIETALGTLNPRLPAEYGKKCAVVLRVDTYRTMPFLPSSSEPVSQEVKLYIFKDGDTWKVDDGQLEALLSLVSYSVWAAKQNRRRLVETNEGRSLAHSESLGHLTEESDFEESQSIGWLRAKAPESRIYDIIIGISSPRLMSDLHWWVADTKQDLKKAKIVHTGMVTRVLADFTGPLSDVEANYDKVERPALGFYVDDGTLGENDILCSWECKEQQAPVFHLFSTFIWAAAPYLSASKFHPSAVTCTRQLSQWARPDFAQLKSDRIEMLVQELQIAGLGTSEEIYKMLIPPLSHFKVLPNEAMADFWNEALIKEEGSRRFQYVFVGYSELLRLVQHREVQDRFAYRVAAMFIEFRLRVSENFDNPPNPLFAKALVISNGHVEDLINDNTILKAIMKLNHILATRWGLQNSLSALDGLLMDENPGQVLFKLGLVDLLSQPQRENLSARKFCTLDNTLMDYDYSFPNDTDVFGWTKEYWDIFKDPEPVSAERFSDCSALDIAGRSALHNKIDRNRKTDYSKKYRACFLYGGRGPSYKEAYLSNSSIFIARCNKQTPLHRAARLGHRKITRELLNQGGTDPNAVDHCGRTALSLATYHGGSGLVRMLYDRMEPDGRARTDKEGRNALHYAVLNQNIDAALTLIEAGIEINARDHLGWPPLWYAAQKDMNLVVISLLRKDEIDICILPEKNKYPTSQDSACQDKIKQIAEEIRKFPTADMLMPDSETSGDSDLSDIQDHRDSLAILALAGSEDDTSDGE